MLNEVKDLRMGWRRRMTSMLGSNANQKKFLKKTIDCLLTTSEALEKFDPKSRRIYWLKYLNVGGIVVKLFRMKKHYLILDAGCGDAILLNFLPKLNGGAVYIGVDIGLKNIQRARSRLRRLQTFPEGYFLIADVETLPLKGYCVDVVISIEVLEHLVSPMSGLHEMSYVLKQTGKLVLTTPSAFKLGGRSILLALRNSVFSQIDKPPKQRETFFKTRPGVVIPHREFTCFELSNLVKKYFRIINISSFTFSYVYVILKKILPQIAFKKIFYGDLVLRRVPVVRRLGDHWLVIGEKSPRK